MAGTFIAPWHKLAVAVESTKGTPIDDASCSVLRGIVEVPRLVQEPLESSGDPTSLLKNYEILAGEKYGELTVRVPLKGSGQTGTAVAPRLAPLLRAAGFGETLNDGPPTYALYTPANSSLKAITAKLLSQSGAYRLDLTYAVAERIRIYSERGLLWLEATLRGKINAEALGGSDISYTPEATSQLTMLGAALTTFPGGNIREFELTIENTIAPVPDPTESDGIKGFEVSWPRTIRWRCDPMVESATKLDVGGSTNMEVSFGSEPNKLVIDIDNSDLVSREVIERDNQIVFRLESEACATTDDILGIKFQSASSI